MRGENGPRRLGVEQDKGIFGIFGDHVLEAPRERVRALLAFIDGHENPALVCCHVVHWVLLKNQTLWKGVCCDLRPKYRRLEIFIEDEKK